MLRENSIAGRGVNARAGPIDHLKQSLDHVKLSRRMLRRIARVPAPNEQKPDKITYISGEDDPQWARLEDGCQRCLDG